MNRRMRQVLGFALLATTWAASSAAAATMRPALSSPPFTQVSDAAAQAARQTPVCPNGLVCYSPSHLRDAYDFPNVHATPSGAGQTILVVEAYGSPTIQQDLGQFDTENGLPDPPSFALFTQKVPVSPVGSGDLRTWAVETSLDVEYAHAMAPGARIVLAVADTDDSANLIEVLKEAVPQYPGAIVSLSFGEDEVGPFSDPAMAPTLEPLFAAHVAGGGTVVASSGDLGASNFTIFCSPALHCSPTAMADYPASSPSVLAVGGTEGDPYPGGLWNAGHYGGERVWNEVLSIGPGAPGGAPSRLFAAPPWQAGFTGVSTRAEPDVSYNAANNGGVLVVLGGRHGVVGGTSAAAPQWAAIVALADELRGKRGMPGLGAVAPLLYGIAADRHSYAQDFHDVTTGSNALFGDPTKLPGFSAGPGYDLASGLGTPDVARLIKDLAAHDRG